MLKYGTLKEHSVECVRQIANEHIQESLSTCFVPVLIQGMS